MVGVHQACFQGWFMPQLIHSWGGRLPAAHVRPWRACRTHSTLEAGRSACTGTVDHTLAYQHTNARNVQRASLLYQTLTKPQSCLRLSVTTTIRHCVTDRPSGTHKRTRTAWDEPLCFWLLFTVPVRHLTRSASYVCAYGQFGVVQAPRVMSTLQGAARPASWLNRHASPRAQPAADPKSLQVNTDAMCTHTCMQTCIGHVSVVIQVMCNSTRALVRVL